MLLVGTLFVRCCDDVKSVVGVVVGYDVVARCCTLLVGKWRAPGEPDATQVLCNVRGCRLGESQQASRDARDAEGRLYDKGRRVKAADATCARPLKAQGDSQHRLQCTIGPYRLATLSLGKVVEHIL